MKEEVLLYKQLFIFSSILFVALALSFVFKYQRDKIGQVTQKAAAAANKAGQAFGDVMTEDLNANLR